MKSKNDIDITIGGKTFTLSGVESEDYLREVAAYLNEKIRGFSDDASYWRLPNDMRNVMLQLNLADDFFKEHSRAAALEAQVQELEEQRAQADSDLEEVKKSAQEAAVRITELEADAAGLRDRVQRASAAENSATKRFGAEKSRPGSFRPGSLRFGAEKSRAGKLEEELDALRRSKAEADKAVQRLKEELAKTREDLSQELGRTKTDLEQKLSDSESRRKKEVGDLQQLRKKEMADIQEQRKKEVKELQDLREKDVKNLQAQRQQEVREILGRHEKEIREKEASSARTLKEREDSLQKELAETRKNLTGKLEAQKKEAGQYKDKLARAEAEIGKLRSGLETARRNEEETGKKLSALEKEFDERLRTGTEKYVTRTREAEQALAKTQEDLAVLQEKENEHMQAAARVRDTMQEIVSQYGRFGKSLEEAVDQMRALE